MTPKIQLIGVKKRFGSKVVLDGVDLTIEPRSSLVIIGGSGTGKSVTIKSILGIIRPDEGTILVDGEDITHINGAARDRVMKKFGMLFQGGAQGVGAATTAAVVSSCILILATDFILTALLFSA